MTNLNTDVILHIGSFMSASQTMAFTRVNKEFHANRDQLLGNLYEKFFGGVHSPTQQPDKKIIARLLCYAENQPDAAVNHNISKAPSDLLERWKWLAGVENSVDRETQENYNTSIRFLENFQATSIIQLKQQLQGFWHADRQMKDYLQFKSDEKAQATSDVINKTFLACSGFLFRSPSVLNVGKKLESRSREIFAKIGGFDLDCGLGRKQYDVVAFHILVDEQSVNKYKTYQDDTHRKFDSRSYGRTYIGIFEREQPHALTSLGHHDGSNHNFSVLIGRGMVDIGCISYEVSGGHGEDPVLKSKRHLIIADGLEYRGRTRDVQGSDRVLDQKLTQIMVEMAMQNKEIISMRVESNHDDLPVLTAGGFESDGTKRIIEELTTFRSVEGNKLFPPYRDYSGVNTKFETKDFTEQKVYYSRGAPESWSDIIRREPILQPKAAILPEYWARKPHVIDG